MYRAMSMSCHVVTMSCHARKFGDVVTRQYVAEYWSNSLGFGGVGRAASGAGVSEVRFIGLAEEVDVEGEVGSRLKDIGP